MFWFTSCNFEKVIYLHVPNIYSKVLGKVVWIFKPRREPWTVIACQGTATHAKDFAIDSQRFTLFWRMGTPIHNFGRCDSHFRRLDSHFGSHFLAGKWQSLAKSCRLRHSHARLRQPPPPPYRAATCSSNLAHTTSLSPINPFTSELSLLCDQLLH